jgi:large subunit ribosomal protein L22
MANSISSAQAISKKLRVSPRKLALVASMITGKKVDEAIRDLTFCRKAIAVSVKKCLRSAIANAENNFGLDIDNLVVSRATVGKALLMKRFRARAKGRAGRIDKFFSNLYITVEELEAE